MIILPKSGMELVGSSNMDGMGGLWRRGGCGGGGGGGGRMHWMTEWCCGIASGGPSSTGALNSLPGGAGSSSLLTGIISGSMCP